MIPPPPIAALVHELKNAMVRRKRDNKRSL
jgi:hypothetical protein